MFITAATVSVNMQKFVDFLILHYWNFHKNMTSSFTR